jgi:Spy/CpxP family protein refolding chaperone
MSLKYLAPCLFLIFSMVHAPAQLRQRPLERNQKQRPARPMIGNRPIPMNLLRRIGITQEQLRQIRQIRRNNDDQIVAVGRRLREARRALEQAMIKEPFDEALVKRRAEELAQAQAEAVRLQAEIRAQIRKILTPEQVNRLMELEREYRQRQSQQDNQPNQEMPPETSPPAGELDSRGADY